MMEVGKTLPGLGVLDAPPDWTKDRKLVHRGFKDLQYLPRTRSGWNCTLAAYAFSARLRLAGPTDLKLWAAMHGLPPTGRYAELGDDALVLWHGTSAARAERIREHGLFSKGGVWAAIEPKIAHAYTRGRSQQFGAGSATVVLVVSKNEWDSKACAESDHIVRFYTNVPRECVEYILFDDRIEFVGACRAREPQPWGVAHFRRREGRWVPRSRPPVRLDGEHSYSDFAGWLELSVRRILDTLGEAAAVEVFSSLYATIEPWKALEHDDIFAALDKLCCGPKRGRGGVSRFSLA